MRHDEHALQVAIHGWLEKTFDCEVVAVPNGGSRGRMEAIRFKAEGVQAGHPDLIVYAPGAVVRHLEVKTDKGALTSSQKTFLPRLAKLGFTTAVVRSLTDVQQLAKEWALPKRQRRPVMVEGGF